ncbi:hypothetical protein D3C87_1689020 [compost metagenome]
MFAHGGGCFIRLAMDNRGHDFVVMIVVAVDTLRRSRQLTQMLPARLAPDGINGIKQAQHQAVARGFGNSAMKGAVPQFIQIAVIRADLIDAFQHALHQREVFPGGTQCRKTG